MFRFSLTYIDEFAYTDRNTKLQPAQRGFLMGKLAIILVAVSLLLGCSPEQTTQPAESSIASAKKTTADIANPASTKPLLVFFINPTGGPCIMQADILAQMADELEEKVTIRPVKTSVPEDMQLFYAYGIRGLPLLILTDSKGNEIKRLRPGVQPAERIRTLVNQIPEN